MGVLAEEALASRAVIDTDSALGAESIGRLGKLDITKLRLVFNEMVR